MYRQYPEDVRVHVHNTFQARAQGTFLWVGIVAKMLRTYRATQVKTALELFPPGLEEIYTRVLLQIEAGRRQITAQILNFVTTAVRPLTLAELGALLEPAVGRSSSTTSDCNDEVRDHILDCGYFLVIEDEKVNLIHQSAREYLQGKKIHAYPELDIFFSDERSRHRELATRCFDYLQNGSLANGPVFCTVQSEQLQTYPLLSYAVPHWPDHAKHLPRTDEIFNLSRSFYDKSSIIRSNWIKSHPDSWLQGGPPESSKLLHIVCYFGLFPLFQNILHRRGIFGKIKLQFDLQKTDEVGRQPLDIAASGGHVAIVRALLERGADVDTQDPNGDTALFKAIRRDQLTIVQLLLGDWGANVKLQNNRGDSVLHLGALWGNEAIVRLLLERGADVEARGPEQETPLHVAAAENYEGIVKLLLAKGADSEVKNEKQQTPLHIAANYNFEGIVRLLLEGGANIEARDKDQETPLHSAVAPDSEGVVRLLLEKRANVETKGEYEMTPLHTAANLGRQGIVELLLEKGANIEARDEDQQTTLYVALSRVDVDIVRILLQKGALIDAKACDGRTSLHVAMLSSCIGQQDTSGTKIIEIAKMLFAKGADPNAKDDYGATPLHWLVEQEFEFSDRVQLLIENGVDAGIKDIEGTTALQSAEERKHEAIVRLLTPLTPDD